MKTISEQDITPCGMDCAICKAYLRANKPCLGCRKDDQHRSKARANCVIRNCTKRKGKYCFDCSDFPCAQLKKLDKRYRSKYGMSEIENLEFIRDMGIEEFINTERGKWQASQKTLCVHDKKYY